MELFYRQMGQGTPLIILHGLFGMSDNWMGIARKIAEKHNVYIPDQRNHGRSPHHYEFNYRVLLEDLEEFVNSKNMDRVTILGHSLGGKIGMLYAFNHPERLNKLVVVDIAPKNYDRPLFRTFLKQLLSIDLRGLKTRGEADKRLAEKISDSAIRQFLLKNLYKDDNQNFQWRINLMSLFTNINAILGAEDIQGSWNGPTLFVRGGQSDYITDKDFPEIKELFPKAEIETIPSATHWVHSDAPDAFCNILRNFL